MPKIIALIPARGGSKGIPFKNIAILAGKPLISYSISAALSAKVFDRIYVSSDDSQILACAESFGAVAVKRASALASDESTTNSVIESFVVEQQLNPDDVIVLLQPTSPLRNALHIEEAIALFKSHSECAALISVCEADNKFLYALLGADPYVRPVSAEYMNVSRRQDLPSIFLPNGALYIFTVRNFQRNQSIPKVDVIAYKMPQEASIDIDVQDDIKRAEFYLTNSQRDDN